MEDTWVQYETDGETLVGQVDALQQMMQITNLHFVDPRQVLQPGKDGCPPDRRLVAERADGGRVERGAPCALAG